VSPSAVSADLIRYGARPWQSEITAVPVSGALLRIIEEAD
jgi:hypothetical protein